MSKQIVIRVQLVDDHALVRDGVRSILERYPAISVVAMSASGEEGYSDYFEYSPDVVLLDVAMPGEGGLSALRRILARDVDARILMLSMYDDEVIALKAVEAGACGFLSKGVPAGTLYDGVLKVAAGERYVEPAIAQRMALLRSGKSASLSALSKREFEVFCLLAEGKGVSEIATLLYLSPKTVGTHRTRIMEKLACGNVAELARMAIRQGIITA